jgi:hypothetical protein
MPIHFNIPQEAGLENNGGMIIRRENRKKKLRDRLTRFTN